MNCSHFPHWPVSRSILARTLIAPTLAGLGLLLSFPDTGQAATATGGTTTTMTLKYYSTGSKWVMRSDPENVESFQLHIQFDDGEVVPDLTFSPEMGVDARNPFTILVVPDGANGYQVSGTALSLSPGDVDLFEGRFTATPPVPAPSPVDGGSGAGSTGNNKPLSQIKFTMFAKGNDFIMARDPGVPGSASRRITAAEIGATSRTVKPGVNPMVWDPDGVNDNGTMGGPGTWNTTGVSWDNLSTNVLGPVQAFPNVFWDNSINVNDEAIFGGNPGTGIVTLAEPISAGGLRFDMPGYTLQGGSLNLSKPDSAEGTVDTGGNDATVNSPIMGSSGLQKIGKGTLTLGGANTYTGATMIEAGTVQLVAGTGSLNTASPLTFTGNGKFAYQSVGVSQTLGALRFREGEGVIDLSASVGGASLQFASLTALPRATGNFVPGVSGGGGSQIVNIDFEGRRLPEPSAGVFFGPGAAGGGPIFNGLAAVSNGTPAGDNLTVSGTNLLDANGAPTSVSFTISPVGGDHEVFQGFAPASLYDDFIFNNDLGNNAPFGSPFTISGLVGTTADLFFYLNEFNAGTMSITGVGGNGFASTFNGLNATLFPNVPIISGAITGFFSANGLPGALGGLTVNVFAPPPPSPSIGFAAAPPSDQLISARLFFNGADYAAYSGAMRALNYGADANTSPINVFGSGTDVKLTIPQPVVADISIRTVNLSGPGASLSLSPNTTLTLTQGGILKSGGGASTISQNMSGGITTGGATELVVRTDTVADVLTIASPILSTTTGGLTKSGTGTLILSAANQYTGPTTLLAGITLVNGSINPASPVSVRKDATLGGSGSVGALSGAGTVSPGASAGILTATSVDPSLDMGFHFEIGQFAPDFLSSSASVNDVLRLTDTTPFTAGLCASNRLLFEFYVPLLTVGELFIVGFFTDGPVDYAEDVRYAAYVSTFNGGPMPADLGVVFHQMIPQNADFGAGQVAGRALQIRVVPEPGTLSLLLFGTLGLLRGRRRRLGD